MNLLYRFALKHLIRRLDALNDVEITALADRLDERIDIPFLNPGAESRAIRATVRAAIHIVRELSANLGKGD